MELIDHQDYTSDPHLGSWLGEYVWLVINMLSIISLKLNNSFTMLNKLKRWGRMYKLVRKW